VSETEQIIGQLDRGERRVASKVGDEWVVDEEAKRAILDYFGLRKMEPVEVGPFEYHDKIPLKRGYEEQGVRVVPPATVRYGAYISPGAVLMPSYVNIGAWIGPGTMVDTWATVGSCAQIGANVHLAGGVGIGGVLEPVNARPVVIEDNAFVGSRAIIVEGVLVGEGAVIAPNVSLTASVPIIDVTGPEPVERPTASAAYSFVRFSGGAIAPWLAGKLAERYDVHVPFLVGGAAVLVAIAVLALHRNHIAGEEPVGRDELDGALALTAEEAA